MFAFRAGDSVMADAFLFKRDGDFVGASRFGCFGGGDIAEFKGDEAVVNVVLDEGAASTAPFATARFRGILER